MCDSVWKYMWVRQFADYLYFSKWLPGGWYHKLLSYLD